MNGRSVYPTPGAWKPMSSPHPGHEPTHRQKAGDETHAAHPLPQRRDCQAFLSVMSNVLSDGGSDVDLADANPTA
ncbi:hypothetical protein PG993_003671 [Apiospora rasikravindrae]|uniref:DUF397 domain-containing protein n=1 Tax=Apiospora rasikravindrae TaxID=990691 RepID=A0ABR1U067_9PEZI